MTTIDNDIKHKFSDKYSCIDCDYRTSRKCNFNTHILSSKHAKNVIATTKYNDDLSKKYTCGICDKGYNDRAGLWRHKKKCLPVEETQIQDNIMMNLVVELQKQNHEFQKQMLETLNEVCKNNNSNVLNQCNINSNNKAFNLNVFLNEDCKDAMNVNEFIDSFNLQLSDFENVGNVGFVNGISDIIIKKLKALDISERPIHCTDQKRQVLYAKVIDKWEKEGDDNKILRRIIKCVAFKNSKNIQLFRDKYPDCMNWDSKHADRYQILRIESLGGLNNEDIDNENKIIRKIAKEILIDKSL